MKLIDRDLQIENVKNECMKRYLNFFRGAVVDIETTGLSASSSAIILIGIIIIENMRPVKTIQLFAENVSEESLILKEYADIISNLDYVITYNGRVFDIPFLKYRMKKHHINYNEYMLNLDLLHFIRTYTDLKYKLPDLKQKTVEKYMGLSSERTDKISGKESVEAYIKFIKCGSEKLLSNILRHNYDDIIQLYKLTDIVKKHEVDRYMYNNGIITQNGLIQNISLDKYKLNIKGIINITDRHIYNDDYMYEYKIENRKFIYTQKFINIDDTSFIDTETLHIDASNISDIILDNGCIILRKNKSINYKNINLISQSLITNIK